MATRRKGAAIDAPATNEAAIQLIGVYGSAEHQADLIRAQYGELIAKATTERDAILAGIEAEQKPRFAQLKAWWAVEGHKLAGAAKSADLAGAKIGERMTTPALQLPKGKPVAQIIDELIGWLGGDFVRTKYELDKEAIIARLRRGPRDEDDDVDRHEVVVLAENLRLSVTQREEFFISVTPAEPPKIEQDAT